MPKFTFRDGKTMDFEEFPIKEANLRKINIEDEGKSSEGVWACFSDSGLKDYDRNHTSSGYEGVCILQNNAINFFPVASWGVYVPVKFRGSSRPLMDLADMDGEMIFCRERLEQEAKAKEKAKNEVV